MTSNELPIPAPNGPALIYGGDAGHSVLVERQPDGSFYGNDERGFEFDARDEAELLARLAMWGCTRFLQASKL